MKLRYVTYKNRVTANEVSTYAATKDISIMEAKTALVNESEPTLQVWVTYDQFGNGTWETIEHITEYRNA